MKTGPKTLKDMYAAMQGSKPTKSRLVKPPTEKGNRVEILAQDEGASPTQDPPTPAPKEK